MLPSIDSILAGMNEHEVVDFNICNLLERDEVQAINDLVKNAVEGRVMCNRRRRFHRF